MEHNNWNFLLGKKFIGIPSFTLWHYFKKFIYSEKLKPYWVLELYTILSRKEKC